MKAFEFVLLCALAAVQGRSTALKSTDESLAALGQDPWLVHLRVAVSTSGQLNTGVGSLITPLWVLTTAENLVDARFIWLRYGVVEVINPSLVTESSLVNINPDYNATTGENNIGLINTNRPIGSQSNIATISFAIAVPGHGRVCVFGPHGVLQCFHVNVGRDDHAGLYVYGGHFQVTAHDYGTPVVTDDGLIGMLVGPGSASEDSVGEFLVTDIYFDWIETETGVLINPDPNPDVAPEAVHFVQ